MANFINPLDKYITYSYYHILVMCNTTETAELLNNSSLLLETGRSNENIEEKYKLKSINSFGQNIDINNNKNSIGDYIILFNGSTDSEFIINDVRWDTLLYPATDDNYYTTISTEGKMEIQEPSGARFLNIINNSIRKLGIDINSIVFMLKTIFVGRTHSNIGVGEEYITSIKPLIFVLYDVEAVFDIVGATYQLSFIPLTNGAAKMKQYNQAPNEVSSISLEVNSSLLQAINKFSSSLNVIYGQYATQVIENSKRPQENFIYITYNITCDEIYKDENFYKIDNFQDQSNNFINGGVVISFGESPTIESALNKIMRHCTGVLEDGKGKSKKDPKDKNTNNTKYSFKIISSVETFKSTILVNYRIVRYALPTESIIEKVQNGDIDDEIVKNNAITFDYIYTGRNDDILEFEMKLAMGVAFLQILSSTNNIPEDKTQTSLSSKIKDQSSHRNTSIINNPNNKTILAFPTTEKNNNSRNTKKPYSSSSFNSLLGRFAALEGIDAKIKIRGNPIFLTNMTILPSDIQKNLNTDLIKGEFNNIERVPSLCKINIKMPRSNSFPGVDDNNINSYEDFWYKGYYYIYSIENVFDGSGNFYQEIDLMSLPQDLGFIDDEKIIENIDDINTSTEGEKGNIQIRDIIKNN